MAEDQEQDSEVVTIDLNYKDAYKLFGGGGGDGSSAPPVDTYVSDIFKQDAVKREKASTFAQIYMNLWGEPATEEYLIAAVNEGLNAFEFTEREKQKPAFAKTPLYKETALSLRDLISQIGAW
jgi:hypothetical protein